MIKRLFLSAVLVTTILMTGSHGVLAQSEVSLTIINPTERQTVHLGETVHFEFEAIGFEPAPRRSMHLTLLDRTTQRRILVKRFTEASSDDRYTVEWTVPDNFFYTKQLVGDRAHFRLLVSGFTEAGFDRKYHPITLLTVLNKKAGLTVETTPEEEPEEPQEPAKEMIDLTGKSLAARYEFRANAEPWVIKKVTVVNDTEDDGFDDDPNEQTNVVDTVYVRYPNSDGELEVKSSSFANGKATLSGLDFFLEKNGSAVIEVFVDPIDVSMFNQFSGETYRVGIQDLGNDASSFEAVGQFSGATDNSLSTLSSSAGQVEEFIVRQASPVFSLVSNQSRTLIGGTDDFYEFRVSSVSTISLNRLVFEVTQNGLTTVDQVQFFRDGSFMTPGDAAKVDDVYLLWDAGGSSCFAHTTQSGAGTGMDCAGGTASSSKLIVTFPEEERIFGGTTKTYRLRMNVLGVSNGDNLAIRLSTGDDFAKPSIGGTVATTGEIYNGGAGNELFSNASDFASEATTITNRNIIWSDRSADVHLVPSMAPAALPVMGTDGSADYTNGYLLKVNTLPNVISSD